jgi:hypothetical protein
MKKYFVALSLLLALEYVSFGQATDSFISSCVKTAGADAKYLKDFRVELGQATVKSDMRFKANMSLWQNTKYRFTLCNSDDSKGRLILNIKDEANRVVLSSFDSKTGKSYPSVDFTCNKTGLYTLSYDFTDEQQGSGVGVVSVVK